MRNAYFLLVLVALLIAPARDAPQSGDRIALKLPSLRTMLACVRLG